MTLQYTMVQAIPPKREKVTTLRMRCFSRKVYPTAWFSYSSNSRAFELLGKVYL